MPNPSADKIAVPLENVLMRDGSNVTNLNDSIVDLENSFASSDWKNIESSQGLYHWKPHFIYSMV